MSSCSINKAEENKLCLRKFKVYSFISKSEINTTYKVITFGKDGDSVRFVLNNDINIGEVKITKDSSAVSINGIRKIHFLIPLIETIGQRKYILSYLIKPKK